MSNKTKPDLIIFVKGGVVQDVASRFPELKVSLCDWDNADVDANVLVIPTTGRQVGRPRARLAGL